MKKEVLTPGQLRELRESGLVVLRGFYDRDDDIVPVQRGIHQVIGQVMARNGHPDSRREFFPEHFDEGYLDLCRANRAWGGEVYDAVKQVPAFMRLVSHPAHEAIVSQVREGAVPGLAAGGYGIRIDNPFEDKYRAMWHQEYPAQLRSVDGLVFWSPLVPVTQELGPVQVCPGSHREGPLRVMAADPEGAGRAGAYSLKLENEAELLARYPKVAPLTAPGDLMIMDFLLLHASGHNTAARSRWTMQFRYFNFAEPTGRSHGWKGSYAAGVDFRAIHPELWAS